MKQVFVLFLIIFSFAVIQAQKSDEDLRVYFSDAEFFLTEEEYLDALYDYMELYNNGFNDNANINYRIGICYLNIPGQKDKSIPYLEKATENTKTNNRESEFREEKAPMDAYLYLGNAYRVNNDLDNAIELYEKYKGMLPSSDKASIGYVDQQIQACNAALKFMENPVELVKTNLGDVINTSSSDFKAVISGDGEKLVYMKELPFYDAVYFSQLKDGKWTEPENITPQIQSDGDQYVSSISHDGTNLYLTKEDNFNSDIYISTYENGQWTKSRSLPKPVYSKYWESHGSISKDGRTLYFTSNRRGGYGAMDIYKTVLDEEDEWTDPTNVGSTINTSLNEDTPFITEDGKSMFFSSQGHNSMGGYDIYVSTLDDEGNWAEPQNLGYPINTTDDDLFYYPWNNGKIAYLALFDQDSYGKEDIYSVRLASEKIIEEVIAEKIETDVEKTDTMEKQVIEEEKIEEVPEEIVEEVKEKPLEEEVAEIVSEEVSEEEVEAKPATEIMLKPVYFRFDDYSLTEDARIELNKVASLLIDYKNLRAKLKGHTDAIGPAAYNQILSEKRATSTMNYLVNKGIDKNRLEKTGFGETIFAAINKNPDGSDSPEGRKLNRRVEFEIIGIEENNIIIKRIEIPEQLRFVK
jgi:outer membrane protein OmpA-like peptidoglycan-associated protein